MRIIAPLGRRSGLAVRGGPVVTLVMLSIYAAIWIIGIGLAIMAVFGLAIWYIFVGIYWGIRWCWRQRYEALERTRPEKPAQYSDRR